MTAAGVPCGPVNTIAQVQARDMEIHMTHPAAQDEVSLIGNPIKYSKTTADYRRAPPMLGQHTEDVLAELFGLGAAEIAELREKGII